MTAGMDKAAVLAVMDDAAVTLQKTAQIQFMERAEEMREARAAVAEVYAQRDALVEALKQARRVLIWHTEYRGGPNRVDAATIAALDSVFAFCGCTQP